ncbi:MAG: trimeric intracellular cation channel family protein [Bacillales bacterium]|jgi:uncharacterized membrane protein YeiH|nr:trimeric intracellular cation channel family protein [Bacillales bacterium]
MELLNFFVFIGIVACGVSGALTGISKNLDLFGVICLGLATSLGGGIVRDILLGETPPVAFINPSFATASFIASIVTWIFYHKAHKIKNIIIITDAIGLGVFTAVGANKAIEHGLDDPFIIVAMGLITGIGGGVLRDVFTREIPFVFQKEIYAIASLIGCIVLILTYHVIPSIISLYLCLIVTFVIRIVSVRKNYNFPVIENSIEEKIN